MGYCYANGGNMTKKSDVSFTRNASLGPLGGFTLIELMVVVAIVAILATIALPSYRDYVLRGRIAEGTAALTAKRTAIEQWFDNNRTYATAPAAICTNSPTTSFAFACTVQTATAFTITATGQGPAAGFAFTIDETGARATTGVPAGWATNANCWVSRRDGSC
jgi:type IV pilus assembly protein PilE